MNDQPERTNIERLGPGARVWVFTSSQELDEARREAIESSVGGFLEDWESHGVRLPARCRVLHDRFLVVAADERTDPSGCSIDKLFRLLQQIASEAGTSLLESHHVFYRGRDGSVRSVTRQGFRELADRDEVDTSTVVFDTTVDRLGPIVDGGWEKPAGDSWHRQLLST